MDRRKTIVNAVELIRSKTETAPEFGLILGSGLGDYADKIENAVRVPYAEIEEFPVSTVAGHAGQFVIGTHKGKQIIAMQGRIHFYEGYAQEEITLPVRIMKQLGVKTLIITNAAGSTNLDYRPGTLMMIKDHINLSGSNPLRGRNMEEFGPRFPDMSEVYSRSYRERIIQKAAEKGLDLEEGIYLMMSGPCYETPAEVRMVRMLGADAVGMSTVPEAVVAAHSGIAVIGISCLTNMAAGILDQPLNHEEVVETANQVKEKFVCLLDLILEEI